MNTKPSTNWTYLIALTITRAFMLGAAAISFTHIVTTSHLLGLGGFQALTTPFAIDGFATLGMLGRSRRFAETTRRAGLRIAIGAGALSLAANVYAGHTIGERIYGVIVVAAFIAAEQYADRMAPAAAETAAPAVELAPVPTPAEPVAAAVSTRSAAASRGWETRRQRVADAAKAEQAAIRAARKALAD